MDGGAYRAPRQTDRSPSPWKPEDKQAKAEPKTVEPAPVSTPPSSRAEQTEPKKPRRIVLPILIIILIAVIGGLVLWTKMQSSGPTGIDSSKYQAVFFTNGNVYFGKLESLNNGYMKLSDVYYPQTQTSNDQTEEETSSQTQTNVTILKMSEQIHGPDDEMIISQDQIQFFQNLRSDSQVTQFIERQ